MKQMPSVGAFTICTKSYLALARVLAKSFLKHHPKSKFYVLFLDNIDNRFSVKKQPFISFELSKLSLVPNLGEFIFKYDIIGLNTAIKPFFAKYLFDRFSPQKLFYFDTDVLIMGQLTKALKLLDRNNIIITPHLLSPFPKDNLHPLETTILLAGAYNLGFIGLRNSIETTRFLRWWQGQTYDGAVIDSAKALYRDQRPIDLVPGLFNGVVILRDETYNVAYWRLNKRLSFQKRGDNFFINTKRVTFFHFSGYNINDPKRISKYLNRYSFENFPSALKKIFSIYKILIKNNGYTSSIKWPNNFAYFSNKEIITDAARFTYWQLREKRKQFGNPFLTNGSASFYYYYFTGEKNSKKIYWKIKNSPKVSWAINKVRTVLGSSYPSISTFIMETFLPQFAHLSQPIKKIPASAI